MAGPNAEALACAGLASRAMMRALGHLSNLYGVGRSRCARQMLVYHVIYWYMPYNYPVAD